MRYISQDRPLDRLLHRLKRILPAYGREIIRYRLIRLLDLLRLRTFSVGGVQLHYLVHDYNSAWACERTVEVPFVKHYLDKVDSSRTLEIGNVLSHYYQTSHTVIDKYEVAHGVLNRDVADLDGSDKYELIVSISTLEHVGFDETPKDPLKVLSALERLKQMLAPRGILIVSVPLGYNSNLDSLIRDRRFSFEVEHYLRKTSALNTWREVDRHSALSCRYGYPYVAANAIMIGILRNQ